VDRVEVCLRDDDWGAVMHEARNVIYFAKVEGMQPQQVFVLSVRASCPEMRRSRIE
jgi:hypothetical protein